MNLGNKYCALLIMGQSPDSSTYNDKGIGLPFYQGKKEFGKEYPIPKVWCSKPMKIAEPNDILLSVRAPVGPTNLCMDKSCIGRGLAAIRVNENNVIKGFLLYFFKRYEIDIAKKGKGSTFLAITKKDLESTPIPLPPLPEQKRIVSKLDNLFERIDRSIGLAEENIRYKESLLRSSLEEMFLKLSQSEKHYRLKNICEKLNDGTHHSPKNQYPEYQKGRYKYITSKNVKWTGLLLDNVSYLDENIHNEIYKRCNPEYGDLLITKDGAMTGTCCINTIREPFSLLSSVALVKPKEQIVKSKFLYYFFMSPVGEESIFKDIAGAAITRTTIKKLSQIEIPIPPIKTQEEIIQRLDLLMSKSNQVENQYQEKLSNLKVLKSSSLDKAFRGKL